MSLPTDQRRRDRQARSLPTTDAISSTFRPVASTAGLMSAHAFVETRSIGSWSGNTSLICPKSGSVSGPPLAPTVARMVGTPRSRAALPSAATLLTSSAVSMDWTENATHVRSGLAPSCRLATLQVDARGRDDGDPSLVELVRDHLDRGWSQQLHGFALWCDERRSMVRGHAVRLSGDEQCQLVSPQRPSGTGRNHHGEAVAVPLVDVLDEPAEGFGVSPIARSSRSERPARP